MGIDMYLYVHHGYVDIELLIIWRYDISNIQQWSWNIDI